MKRKPKKRASTGDRRKASKAASRAAASTAASKPAEEAPASASAPALGGGPARVPRRKARKAKVPAKRNRAQDKAEEDEVEDSDSEEDEDEDGEADDDGDDLQVEFEFFDPAEDDYHSVGDLIKSGMWEFVEMNFAELADSIVGQGNIGTLVKSESEAASSSKADKEDTVCGLLTALNLRQFAHQSWPKDVREALLKKAQQHASAEVVEKLRGFLQPKEGSEVGLILSERFLNLPPQLIPPLHRALVEDIAWSCTTPECPPEERPFYGFTHFVGVARCFQAKPADDSGRKAKRRKGAAPASAVADGAAAAAAGGLVFPSAEDEIYFQRANFAFTFPLSNAGSSKQRGGGNAVGAAKGNSGRGQEYRAVFGLTKKALERVVGELAKSQAFVPGAEDTAE